nr:response regulator transcription factor [Stenotrophomonas sp. ZAC14A_NAIMI4_1]
MYRVVVADDHPAARLGMKLVAEIWGRCDVVAEVANGRDLVEAIEAESADLVITDLSMAQAGSTDGLALIKLLRRRYPRVRVVVLTISGSAVIVDALVGLGVSGVVSKRDDVDELLEALRNVERAGTHVGKSFQGEDLVPEVSLPEADLTKAEIDVLRQLANNLSVTAIAARSSRSVATISKQKTSAMKKLGLVDTMQLYTYLRSLRGGVRTG